MFKRIVKDERGVALGVSLGVMSVMSVIAALVFASSYELSQTTNSDRNDKRAFQAAEAGLQVATYRLNNLAPLDEQCITNAGIVIIGTGCVGSGELSDGAEWSYHMTPVLSNGVCAGYAVSFDINDPELSLAPRCVTATGTVNGVSKRVQARIVLFKGFPLFGAGGILCLKACTVKNTASVNGILASNGQVNLGNGSTVTGGIKLGPSAPGPNVGNSNVSVSWRTFEQGGWVLSPVEIGNTDTVNDNENWDFSAGSNYTWDPTTRELDLTKGTMTLRGGTYNFCNLHLGNNSTIVLASGATARIFIDSPERATESPCAAGTGRLVMDNNIHNPGASEDLQVYVYGEDPSATVPAVEINNHGTLNFALHAPRASVIVKNAVTLTGGINANYAEFKNDLVFAFGSTLGNLRTTTSAILYQRTAWRECQRQPTVANDPTSGC
jgi:hypothetical protein